MQALNEDLPFPVSITESIYLQESNVFARESFKYLSTLTTFLEYQFYRDSEAVFVSVCGNTLNAVHKSTTVQIFQDQHNASCFKNGAICLIKVSVSLLGETRNSLVNKFYNKADMIFLRRDMYIYCWVNWLSISYRDVYYCI